MPAVLRITKELTVVIPTYESPTTIYVDGQPAFDLKSAIVEIGNGVDELYEILNGTKPTDLHEVTLLTEVISDKLYDARAMVLAVSESTNLEDYLEAIYDDTPDDGA